MSIWNSSYNADRYGVPDRAGTVDDWKAAYEAVMGIDEAEAVLEDHGIGRNYIECAKHLLGMGYREEVTENSLKSAYRKMALRHHPDHGGDEEMFKKMQAAYVLLKDRYGI